MEGRIIWPTYHEIFMRGTICACSGECIIISLSIIFHSQESNAGNKLSGKKSGGCVTVRERVDQLKCVGLSSLH
jgi:hypothetical protein